MKQAVEKRPVVEEEMTKIFVDCKDAVTVLNLNQLKGHGGSAIHGIFISTGRAKTAVAPERNEFKIATMGTTKHGPTEGRIPTVDHFFHVFNNRLAWMKCI